ncbi:MAG TPA: NADH-quinone oxidoreductase subunit N [Actinomycetota bacterium]|nr:NADH-quinone oxidoreductase subunit N [Actinomycetota bacterium]
MIVAAGFTAPHVELAGIGPEVALVVAGLVLLVVDALVGDRWGGWHLPVLATAGFAAAIVLAVGVWGQNDIQFSGMIATDGFAVFSKIVLATFGVLTVWLARDYLTAEGIEEGEFYALLTFAVAGMMLMASAADLIVVFLALEMFSLALYVLVGFRRRSRASQESALKYFLLGAFSSAFFLLGIALCYGATGTTNFYPATQGDPSLLTYLASTAPEHLGLLVIGTGLLIVGLGFKIAAVPFHMWTPDAYQGAPSPVTGFMAAGSKLAGFAALLRLLDATLFSLRTDWRPLLIAVAVATMIIGSVLAVVQEDVKRMLAYSSIAHAGFVLTGVIATSDPGVAGALFYLATYGITVLGAFAVIAVISGREERYVRLTDMKGLFYERPAMAGALTLFLLSLAGVPVTSGFVGKLLVFGAAIQSGYTALVVVGVLTSAIAAFFYLRVLVVMYMQERDGEVEVSRGGWFGPAVIGLAAATTIVLGLYWGPLIDLAEKARFFTG